MRIVKRQTIRTRKRGSSKCRWKRLLFRNFFQCDL